MNNTTTARNLTKYLYEFLAGKTKLFSLDKFVEEGFLQVMMQARITLKELVRVVIGLAFLAMAVLINSNVDAPGVLPVLPPGTREGLMDTLFTLSGFLFLIGVQVQDDVMVKYDSVIDRARVDYFGSRGIVVVLLTLGWLTLSWYLGAPNLLIGFCVIGQVLIFFFRGDKGSFGRELFIPLTNRLLIAWAIVYVGVVEWTQAGEILDAIKAGFANIVGG